MAAFATVGDLEGYIGRTFDEAEQVSVAQALDNSSALIRGYTGQEIDLVTDDVVVLRVRPDGRVFLPQLPVVSVSSVVADGEPTAYTLYPNGVVKLDRWAELAEVTYSHGFESVPDLVRQVCVASAARGLENPTLMPREGLGSYSPSYAQAAFNLGAGPYLTPIEQAALAPFKMSGVA